ncbi:MAG: hypothetical protein ACYTGQ_09935 [Planctomycetota bacterium]|jgi:hypothetical protein
MLNKLAKMVDRFTRGRPAFDPTTLNDPVALRTGWGPAKQGGTNIRTRRLVAEGPNRLALKPTASAMLFYCFFIGMGLIAMILIPTGAILEAGPVDFMAVVMPVFIGVIFVAVGGVLLYLGARPVVFDLQSGWFWKGANDPTKAEADPDPELATPLDKIYALQIVSEYVSGNKNNYYSYELNAVLLEGQRINVTDHGSLRHLREDARQLADFIGVPLWDAA